MKEKIFVVTNTENGWDCVKGIFRADHEDQVYQYLVNEQGKTLAEIKESSYIVHRKYEIIEL